MKDSWLKENKIQVIFISALLLCLMAGWILYLLFGHQLIRAMYEGRSIEILNQIIERRTPHPLEFYFIFADSLVVRFSLALLLIMAYICASKKFKFITINPIIIFLIIFCYLSLSSYNYNSLIITTPDSINHISAAEHLLKGKGFYSIGPNPALYFEFLRRGINKKPGDIEEFHPYTHWPPLYPLLLAASMGILNVEPLTAAIILNRIFFSITITLVYLILAQAAPRNLRLVAPVAAIGLSFFKPFVYIFSFIWAEMTYIGLSILAIYLLYKFYNCLQEKEPKILLFSAVFASLSLLCRYTGIIVIITGLIMIVLKSNVVMTKRKIRNCLVFSGISSFLIFPWLLRNKMLTGSFSGGERPSGSGNILGEFYSAVKVLARDFLFTDNKYMIGFVLVCLLIFAIYKRSVLPVLLKRWINKYLVFILYPFLYLATLIILASAVYVEQIDLRLTVPTYPFIIVSLVLFFYQFFVRDFFR